MLPISDAAGRRRLPHHPSLDSTNQSVIQFVTVCVHRRRPVLAQDEIARLLLECWSDTGHWLVGRYVIMPDHVHLFCAPAIWPPAPLKPWVAFWRAAATRRWPNADDKPVWQRDYFDRQLRTGESYRQKWLYVWENPVRQGLVTRAQDWPFQGELNVLPWHEPV